MVEIDRIDREKALSTFVCLDCDSQYTTWIWSAPFLETSWNALIIHTLLVTDTPNPVFCANAGITSARFVLAPRGMGSLSYQLIEAIG